MSITVKLWHKTRWRKDSKALTNQEKDRDAKQRMSLFYTYIVNSINVRLKSADTEDYSLEVICVALIVANGTGLSPWTENNKFGESGVVDDGAVLYDFSVWRDSNVNSLPRNDHAALYTGFDLGTSHVSTSTVGIAYLNRICKTYSSSVNEEPMNAFSPHIAGHELTHSLGATHDGNGNTCQGANMYLMAPRLPNMITEAFAKHPYQMSSCTKDSVKSYIQYLETNNQNCMLAPPDPSVIKASLQKEKPGLFYHPDVQCTLTFAPDRVSTLCRELHIHDWNSLCYNMQCRIPGSLSCEPIFPFEGTPCGAGKWCQKGECVRNNEAPADTPDICPVGDDPSFQCHWDDCTSYSESIKLERCCQTCLVKTTTATTPVTTSSTTTSSTTTTSTTTPPAPTTTSERTTRIQTTTTESTSTTEPQTTSTTDTPGIPLFKLDHRLGTLITLFISASLNV